MRKIIHQWSLPIAMLIGVFIYILYRNVPLLHNYASALTDFVDIIQPLLIFCMLFTSCCKVDLCNLRLSQLHLKLIFIQLVSFSLFLLVALLLPQPWALFAESVMVCMICPTATAAVVVTQKLGGNHSSVITYVMLINLVVALVIPALCPLLHPVQDESFWGAFYLVISTIFPVIIFSLFAAELLRYICPQLREYIASKSNLSFIIWLVALSIAIAMTTRSIYHSQASVLIMIGIAMGSLIACAFQFWRGGILGRKYGDSVAATQSLGQKNTIFAIWVSYTYLSPIVSVAGGFYSIWHNLYNTYQLSKMKN